MKSSLKNMVFVLLLITLASAAILAVVYSVTKGPIEQAKGAKTTDALSKVIEKFDNNPAEDTVNMQLNGMPIIVYVGKTAGVVSGYAVETRSKEAFSGQITLMVGFRPDGEIYNIEVLQQNETPGLGSKMADPDNPLLVSFAGKNPATLRMAVTKDGGDVDAITASTISSRAYVDAVERAYEAFRAVALGIEPDKAEAGSTDPVVAVLPGHDTMLPAETVEIEGNSVEIYTAQKAGETVGYAVRSESPNGFHGPIRLLVGFLTDGTINDIYVVEQNETSGLGGVIADEDNALMLNFKGRKVGDINFELSQNGGDIDALSGATVTTKAYIEAVRMAGLAFSSQTTKEGRQ